jgi:AhpD family alkylhydroperoxidase
MADMTSTSLSQKEKEVIAVGASVAAGCKPCTAHHVAAARHAGATDEDITWAVDDALDVRKSATEIMAGVALEQLGGDAGREGPQDSAKPLINELTSAAAAFAVSSTTDLETHVNAARQAGASDRQIELALSVARMIKRVANEKVEAAAEALTGSAAEVQASQAAAPKSGCGCS